MSANQADFPIAAMARVLGVSESGYHAWRIRPPSACQIASNCDPHFASNNDPLKEQDWGLAALFSGSGGAVGKWPAGVTV